MKDTIIKQHVSIRESIRILNENSKQILIIVDNEGRLVGVLTDGDIRRAILNNIDLESNISEIMNRNPSFVFDENRSDIPAFIKSRQILAVPVVNHEMVVVDLVQWLDLFPETANNKKTQNTYENPVFILAGGKGTRLKPFTNILPKPLIPVGEIPVIEVIMNHFRSFGFRRFIISLNYKADMIKAYFSENLGGFEIEYVQENEFSGTAGSLALAKNKINETFIVSNCDILVKMDFEEFYNYHKSSGNDATIVGVLKHVEIPYGILDINNGVLTGMKEKPVFDFIVNAGIYALEPAILKMIKDDEFVDMPDLLMKAKNSGLKIGVFPVSSELIDMGQLDEYNFAVDRAQKLNLI